MVKTLAERFDAVARLHSGPANSSPDLALPAWRDEIATPDRSVERRDGAQVLHVGCGTYARAKLPPVFREPGWREIRLDIDPAVHPDFVASITDMHVIADSDVDAVYSSHNLEHLYPHEVPVALQEMRRVLKPHGFLLTELPDLQQVASHIADGRLEEPLGLSSAGPIAPLDILYGHRTSLARGNLFMAHRTGFVATSLATAILTAGFALVMVQRNPEQFALTAMGFPSHPTRNELDVAHARIGLQRPVVVYTAATPGVGAMAHDGT